MSAAQAEQRTAQMRADTVSVHTWTSSCCRIVAPSLVIVTSPKSSTSILSSPRGPSDVWFMCSRPGGVRSSRPGQQRQRSMSAAIPTRPKLKCGLTLTMLATAHTAVTFCERTSCPDVFSPLQVAHENGARVNVARCGPVVRAASRTRGWRSRWQRRTGFGGRLQPTC